MDPTNIPAFDTPTDPSIPRQSNFPQVYFSGARRRRPMTDDDKEVFSLAFEIINRLSKEQDGS